MPAIRKVRRSYPSASKSAYETPTVKILVGDEEALFPVNIGLLQKTSFIAQHGLPRPKEGVQDSASLLAALYATAFETSSPKSFSTIFGEGIVQSQTRDDTTIDLVDDDADYVLEGKFYFTRDAFVIFMRYLNDALPEMPTNSDDCISLFKAYALADHYDAGDLQNRIIDTLQAFYTRNAIPIIDLIYIVRHWGDGTDCRLAAYVVAQVAYEMADDWSRYRAENPELVNLLASNHRVVVEQLFRAAMEYAKPLATADPAKHKRNWRVSMTEARTS